MSIQLSRMLKMFPTNAQLRKLPDELLLIIFKQLNNIDVLYSLFGLNTCLDQIIRDRCFTNEINFIELPDYTSSEQMEKLIDRFCSEILPNIDHLITCLKVQSTSMERILLAGDYSNLSRLEIFFPHIEPVIHINGEKILQLSSFVHNNTCIFIQFSIEMSPWQIFCQF